MMMDICAELNIPVVIVAENKLGAVNQTVLTIDALKNRGIVLAGVVFNRLSTDAGDAVLDDNPAVIAKITGANILGEIRHNNDINLLISDFEPVAGKIVHVLEDLFRERETKNG